MLGLAVAAITKCSVSWLTLVSFSGNFVIVARRLLQFRVSLGVARGRSRWYTSRYTAVASCELAEQVETRQPVRHS